MRQLWSHDDGEGGEATWAENDEKIFDVPLDPQPSHWCCAREPAFSRNSVTRPQSPHVYSNNGMRSLHYLSLLRLIDSNKSPRTCLPAGRLHESEIKKRDFWLFIISS